jgi:hypothetical protein
LKLKIFQQGSFQWSHSCILNIIYEAQKCYSFDAGSTILDVVTGVRDRPFNSNKHTILIHFTYSCSIAFNKEIKFVFLLELLKSNRTEIKYDCRVNFTYVFFVTQNLHNFTFVSTDSVNSFHTHHFQIIKFISHLNKNCFLSRNLLLPCSSYYLVLQLRTHDVY